MSKILITGGSGLIGERLIHFLKQEGNEIHVLSRQLHGKKEGVYYWNWSIKDQYIDESALEVDHIIHLVGASVAEKRWTEARKQEILDSRVDSTRLLLNELKKRKIQLKSFVSASAVGYYGNRNEEILNEMEPAGNGFLAMICQKWEREVRRIENELQVPTSLLRIGIVLSKRGGALPKLVLPAKFGIGAYLGNGQQFFPWIHIDDLCRMFIYAMNNKLKGPFNAVAPHPVSNKELTIAIAKVMNRPFIPVPAPEKILQLTMGEMAEMLLNSQNASSAKIESSGFKFTYPILENALSDIFARKV